MGPLVEILSGDVSLAYAKKVQTGFATNNAHKLEEIRAILGDKVKVLSLKDIRCEAIFRKPRIRWREYRAEGGIYSCALWHGLLCRRYQSGGGSAGRGSRVYSARYAGGEGHDSEANMKKLLAELKGKENRKAQFRTTICLIEGGEKHLFEGIVKGEIIREKKGAPASATTSVRAGRLYRDFWRWGLKEKNRISHRAKSRTSCVTI